MILFGVNFYTGSYNDALSHCLCQSKGYFCFVNAHMVYEHHKNFDFKHVLDSSVNNFPDGMPLVYSLRYFKKKHQDRIAGNDFIYSIIEKAKREQNSIFVFGSTDDVLKKISIKLSFIGINHKVYSPPFININDFDFETQANMINDFNPDMVLVGLGCPKQEIWMYRMRHIIKAPMFGLGGALLLFAGIDSRAPKWMRYLGLEWFYRLALEPKRLFKRYLVTNSFFIYLFVKEFLKKVYRRY